MRNMLIFKLQYMFFFPVISSYLDGHQNGLCFLLPQKLCNERSGISKVF